MVTQVVTYIRTTPTPLLLLFIPYMVLVRMMIKFRITKEKENEKGTKKRGYLGFEPRFELGSEPGFRPGFELQ